MVSVSSEIAPLKKVLVHRPDPGIAWITPRRAEELLFDDIVFLPQMQHEHDIFTRVLGMFLGPENVIEVQTLLEEALEVADAKRQRILDLVVDYEELPKKYVSLLAKMDAKTLANVLVTGYHREEDIVLFDPIPNFIFTRDIAVTINDHLVITKAAKQARHRENLLTRFIIWAHPYFEVVQAENRVINLNDVEAFPPSRRGEPVSLEGGDVMILNKDYLLIGCSERTSQHAIDQLKSVLFERDVVRHVAQINIPRYRAFMHIDTIFTQINERDMVAFSPIVVEGHSSNVEVHRKKGPDSIYSSVKEFIRHEINPDMRFIPGGNGRTPFQEREQWTDACNLVAIKPGVALSYDRNIQTDKALRNSGYEIVPAEIFIRKVEEGKLNPSTVEKTIIALPSNELSRARGGSHCMTCPIIRK